MNESSTCHSCVNGKYSAELGVTECTVCDIGSYTSGELGRTNCDACPPGKSIPYSQTINGTFLEPENGTQLTGCRDCAIGSYSNTTSASACRACHLDGAYYADTTGNSVCKECANASNPYYHYFVANYSAYNSSCIPSEPCPTGHVHTNYQVLQVNITLNVTVNTLGCEASPPGTHTLGGPSIDCLPGYYQDSSAQSQCEPCGTGSYSDESGSASCSQCHDNGYYQDQLAQTACKECASGKYAPLIWEPCVDRYGITIQIKVFPRHDIIDDTTQYESIPGEIRMLNLMDLKTDTPLNSVSPCQGFAITHANINVNEPGDIYIVSNNATIEDHFLNGVGVHYEHVDEECLIKFTVMATRLVYQSFICHAQNFLVMKG